MQVWHLASPIALHSAHPPLQIYSNAKECCDMSFSSGSLNESNVSWALLLNQDMTSRSNREEYRTEVFFNPPSKCQLLSKTCWSQYASHSSWAGIVWIKWILLRQTLIDCESGLFEIGLQGALNSILSLNWRSFVCGGKILHIHVKYIFWNPHY